MPRKRLKAFMLLSDLEKLVADIRKAAGKENPHVLFKADHRGAELSNLDCAGPVSQYRTSRDFPEETLAKGDYVFTLTKFWG